MTDGGKHSGHKYLMEEKAIVKSRHAEAEKHKLICLTYPIHKNILYMKLGNQLKPMPSDQRHCG